MKNTIDRETFLAIPSHKIAAVEPSGGTWCWVAQRERDELREGSNEHVAPNKRAGSERQELNDPFSHKARWARRGQTIRKSSDMRADVAVV